MSVEIPSALIRQIQTTLRKNAGIPPSYDPSDSSLPSLPSLHDALSGLDADDPPLSSSSSSYVRCGKCRRGAGLVRGAQSTLCIFCGRDRRRDGVSHSISFNSTVACKKLLESLQLDGSEVIISDTDSSDSNKGQDAQQDGLVLSSILDLELKWPPQKEEAVNRSSNKAPVSVQAMNLSGVDLDSFFSDSNNKTSSGAPSVATEEFMPNKQATITESYVSSGSGNFGSFKDLQAQDMAVSSDNNKSGGDFADSFADWEAGFQSASSQVFHEHSKSTDHYHGSSTMGPVSSATDISVAAESKSVDLFKGSTTEVSSHPTPASTSSKHANMEHEISSKVDSREPTKDSGHFSSTGSWIQDGLWPKTVDELQSTSRTIDSEPKDDVECMTSTSDSWCQDEMCTTSSMKASNIESKHDDGDDAFDDSFDSWQDFASSNEAPGVSSSSWTQSSEITSNEHASALKTVDLQDMEFGNFLHSDSHSGVLVEEGSPNEANSIQLNASASTSNIEECNNIKSINGKSLEACQDYTSSNAASGDLLNLWTQTTTQSTEQASGTKHVDQQDLDFGSFLYSNSFSRALGGQKDPSEASAMKLDTPISTNSINEFDNTKKSDDTDDYLEAWQDFTSSKEAPAVLPNLWASVSEASTEQAPGVKSVDQQDSEFGSFVYSYSFSGVDGQKSSTEVNDILLDTLVSRSSAEFKSSNDTDDNDGLFGSWKDVTSLSEVPEGLPNSSTQTGIETTSYEHTSGMKSAELEDMEFGGFLQSDMFSGASRQEDSSKVNDVQLDAFVSTSSVKESNNTKNMDDNDDPFEAWQDFISSNDAQGSSANLSRQPDNGATPYEHASGSMALDLQDMGFGSFLYSDPLSGALGGKRGSSEANDMHDGSSSYRIDGTDEKIGAVSIIPGATDVHENNICTSKHESTNSKIEMLLSQMPDLSFMLDDNLSIPKKIDSSNLKS